MTSRIARLQTRLKLDQECKTKVFVTFLKQNCDKFQLIAKADGRLHGKSRTKQGRWYFSSDIGISGCLSHLDMLWLGIFEEASYLWGPILPGCCSVGDSRELESVVREAYNAREIQALVADLGVNGVWQPETKALMTLTPSLIPTVHAVDECCACNSKEWKYS